MDVKTQLVFIQHLENPIDFREIENRLFLVCFLLADFAQLLCRFGQQLISVIILFRNHRLLDTKYTLAGQPNLKMTVGFHLA